MVRAIFRDSEAETTSEPSGEVDCQANERRSLEESKAKIRGQEKIGGDKKENGGEDCQQQQQAMSRLVL